MHEPVESGHTSARPMVTGHIALDKPSLALLALLTLITGLHILAGSNIGLSADGSHYAMYGAYPAWSYFDHPPMIGWMQYLTERFTTSNLGLRLWPIALMAASSVALYRFARDLFPEQSPWFGLHSLLVMQSGVIFTLMGMSMLPDDPLLLFFLLSAHALYRAVTCDEAHQWLWVGLWFGLAGLSKYTAITLVISAVLLMILERRWAQLRTPWPWMAVLIAFVLISPVLWWNWQHDWISMRYQILHVGDTQRSWSLYKFGISQVIQFFSYSPGIFIFGLIGVSYALRRRNDPRLRFLLAIALPLFLLLGASAGLEVSLPHWTAVGWAVLSILIAYLLNDYWSSYKMVRTGVYLSAGYSLIIISILLSQFMVPWIPFKENYHPLADLYGWKRAAVVAEKLRAEMKAPPGPEPVLFAGNWSYASHMAWYALPTPVQIIGDDHPRQMTLWYGKAVQGTRGVLVVPYILRRHAAKWRAKFAYCDTAQELPIEFNGKTATTYYFYRCDGYLD